MNPAPGERPSSRPDSSPKSQRITIGELMVLIVGVAAGLGILAGRRATAPGGANELDGLGSLILLLGGVSLVGPVLLVGEIRRRRRPWGVGKVLWFAQGTAAWMLWPPIVYRQVRGLSGPNTAEICYLYGTPMMAVYTTLALLAGGWIRPRRRRRPRYSWRERFGLVLALLWACTGLYVLSMIYREDLR